MLAILIVIVWKYFGFHMMLFIAALQGMDRNLVEAARIDGATRWQNLRYIVIPLLYPTIRLSAFFAIVGSLQLFDLIMPLTRGGPANSSQTMVSFLYTFGVMRMRVGFGSAVGVILFVHLRHLRLHLQTLDACAMSEQAAFSEPGSTGPRCTRCCSWPSSRFSSRRRWWRPCSAASNRSANCAPIRSACRRSGNGRTTAES